MSGVEGGQENGSTSDLEASEHSHVELIRVTDRTIHISPIDRKNETEITIRNTSEEPVNYVFLPLPEFKLNLQIYDEDGQLLNYYPNSEVEDMIEEVKEEDEEAYKSMQHRFKHNDYKLYVQLPPTQPLEPGGLRTITLEYERSESVSFYSVGDPSWIGGWVSDWKKKFFNIPSFIASAQRYPGHTHDQFVIAVGTPGYSTNGSINKEGDIPDKSFYENGLDDNTRVFSARLPPAESKPYKWDLQYDLIPSSENFMLILVVYWLIAVLSGLVSIGLSLSGIHTGISSYGLVLSTATITGTIGLIFALSSEWTDRYRILCVIPLLIHGVAWVLWTLSNSGSP